MQKIAPFLMFVNEQYGKAEEALQLYVSLFEDSGVESLVRYQAGEPGGDEGLVKTAVFNLAGQKFMASENNYPHGFGFTPALSLFVECKDEAELTRVFDTLAEGGQVLMPLENYGFSQRFGWVGDRYGVTWQLNVA